MRKKGMGKVWLFLVCAIVLAAVGLSSRQNSIGLLKIKSVEVNLDKLDCANPAQIGRTAGLVGQNILFLDSARIKSKLKSRFLCIRDIEISRRPPDKVIIGASGRKPYASVIALGASEATGSADPADMATPSASLKQAGREFLVDNEGIIYAKATDVQNVPKIYYSNGSLALGQRLDNISETLKTLEKVKSFGLGISESEILDNSLVVFPSQSSPKIIFKLADDLDVKLASLQLILGQAKINENQLEFIDLRFDKPIVKFAPKKKNG